MVRISLAIDYARRQNKGSELAFAAYSMNLIEGDYGSRQFCTQYKLFLRNEVRFGGQHCVNSKYNNFSLDYVIRRGYKTTVLILLSGPNGRLHKVQIIRKGKSDNKSLEI